jgi:RHS repeat-associated protein
MLARLLILWVFLVWPLEFTSGDRVFYHADGIGSTKALSDLNGNLLDSYQYDAYGAVENHTGTTANAYRYTGEYFDDAISLQYNRARWYAPGVGRFISIDTHPGYDGIPPTLNRYLYAGSDPIGNSDPSGLITLQDVVIGVQLYYIQVIRTAAPALYSLNYLANKFATASFAQAVTSATRGLYTSANLSANLLRLDAGQKWESFLKPAMENILRAVPQVQTLGSRADWVWRGRFVIDAKFGQYISTVQANNFAAFAARNGGSVTYLALSRPTPEIYAKLAEISSRWGVPVSVVSFLP